MPMWRAADRHRLGLLLVRFSISGLFNGVVYAAGFLVAQKILNLPSFVASSIGYLAGLAAGFLLHRNFTFLAGGAWKRQMVKYLVAQAAVMSIVSGVSYIAANVLQWPTFAVIASGIAVAPVLTFTLLNYWVFPPRTDVVFRGRLSG
jgi:putative flippase GtrA